MKHLFKEKYGKKLSALVALSLFFMPFNIFNTPQLPNRTNPNTDCMNQKEVVDEMLRCCDAAKKHVVVTPEKLAGLDLGSVLRAVVECAYETHTLHELPQGLINCHESLETGVHILPALDLLEALPVVIEKMMDPMMTKVLTRAPRPGAANGVVGPSVCDLSEVIQILNTLLAKINQCCQGGQIECCDELLADFAATFTALDDIKSTLTDCCANIQNNFNGTFTVLALLSTPTIVIDCDFSSVFTVLTELQDTLTLCCANIADNFSGTFTVLNTINNEILGTATAITDISNTLTACCANIQTNFNGTFTAIAAISVAACDLTSVFTVLVDLDDTLTTCCANIQTNFNGTFSAIAAISIAACDLSPVFTTLGNTSDNPPIFDDLPGVADTYLTTTFNIIEWLKAIYAQVHFLSYGS